MKFAKWVVGLGLIVTLASSAQAQYGQNVSVGTTNIVILPAVKPTSGTNTWWASYAYVRGDCITWTNRADDYFWCVTSGTSSNVLPVFSYTNDVSEVGGVAWRYVQPVRNKLILQNQGSGVVYLGFGTGAVLNKGAWMPASGGGYQDGFGGGGNVYQGRISGIADGSTNRVTVQEF